MSSLEERASKITESEMEILQKKAENNIIEEEDFVVWFYIRNLRDLEEPKIITEKEAREAYFTYKIEFGIR